MKNKVQEYIRSWECKGYQAGIPDEAPPVLENLNKVPSYRRIAIAILKNDVSMKYLGFTPKKSIYYDALKKIEIDARPNTVKPNCIQLKLF